MHPAVQSEMSLPFVELQSLHAGCSTACVLLSPEARTSEKQETYWVAAEEFKINYQNTGASV